MPGFEYQALDNKGKTVKGVLSADTPRLARDVLRSRGMTPLKMNQIKEQHSSSGKDKADFATKKGGRYKISSTEFSVSIRQLATLLGSGLTIEDSLTALIKQADSVSSQVVFTGIRTAIMEGVSLADAMALYPRSFNELYVATVSAGEQTGKLPDIMDRLADYTEARQRLQRDIGGKLAYPIIIVVVAIAVVMFLVTFIVPKVVQVYVDNDQQLPLITQIVISLSNFFRDYGLILLLILSVTTLLMMSYFRREEPKLRLHKRLLNFSLFTKLIRGINTARMSRTLSIMVGSGVPLLASMKSSSRVLSNMYMRREMEKATVEVSEGVSLSRAIEKTHVFSPMLVQMIYSGEASGTLGLMLDKAAESTENELQARINTLVTLFEPIMVLIMGLVVFTIVVAIMLPIFDLNDVIG